MVDLCDYFFNSLDKIFIHLDSNCCITLINNFKKEGMNFRTISINDNGNQHIGIFTMNGQIDRIITQDLKWEQFISKNGIQFLNLISKNGLNAYLEYNGEAIVEISQSKYIIIDLRKRKCIFVD
jgi:hypothetical protein